MQDGNFSIVNKTKSTLTGVPFHKMKNFALGEKYELSLVFIGNKKSKELNKSFRGKDKPTNILSFPLSKSKGEIFITLDVAKKEAPKFGRNITNFVSFLFIHGLMHLKGMSHGSKMERAEAKLRKQFGI
jgi:probable rRNA maturation factor